MRTSKRAVGKRAVGCRPPRLLLSIGALAGVVGAADATAAIPEFGRFHAALVAQDKQAALAFIAAFPSSPLVEDLIEMLPRPVAQDVCADLPSGAARAQEACRKADLRVGARDLWGEPIVTDDSDVAPAAPQASAEDTTESGLGDADIAPAAGPAAPMKAVANARARPAGTTGERRSGAIVTILPPGLEQNAAADEEDDKPATTSAHKEADATPKARRDPAPPAPRLGGDPGSDPGAASSPSSHGGDPGSDPGNGAGGDAGRDSHN